MTPDIHTARYVNFNHLFAGLDLAVDEFDHANSDFTYGDNDRTLVSVARFKAVFAGGSQDPATRHHLDQLFQRLDALPAGTYLNLEN